MNGKLYPLALFMLVAVGLRAQEADSARWHGRVATGFTAVSGMGRTMPLVWAAPSFSYRPGERLTLHGGFAATTSLLPQGYEVRSRGDRSLAPLRTGTRAAALWGAAEYRPNGHLSLWGSLLYVGGHAQPLWLDASLPVEAFSVSGGAAYRFDNGSTFEMFLNYTSDIFGTLLNGMFYRPYSDPLVPTWHLYDGPWPF